MNLDEVIAQFETEHKGAFSKDDREKIIAAMKSLDLNDFYIRYRKDVKLRDGSQYSVYFRDNADEIHVHPTMIVARSEFEGSDLTIRSKYRQYPHIAQLSGWISKDGTARPTCPNCFLELPLVGVCGKCEFDINVVEDD